MTLLDRLLDTLDPGTAPDIFSTLWDEYVDLLRPHVRNELVKRFVNFDDLGQAICVDKTHDVALPIFLSQAKTLRAMWDQSSSKVTQEGKTILLHNYYRALGRHISPDAVEDFVKVQIADTSPVEVTNQIQFLIDVLWRRASARVFRRIIT